MELAPKCHHIRLLLLNENNIDRHTVCIDSVLIVYNLLPGREAACPSTSM
jgi:hypothetical protein